MRNNMRVGVIGASSLVGESLLPLLVNSGYGVVAFSRQPHTNDAIGIEWRRLNSVCPHPSPLPEGEGIIPVWICAAPIWVLPDYFDFLKESGVKRIVTVSSTSRFTKDNSSDVAEQAVARKLLDGEAALQNWAEDNDIDWCVIRPTMIYGLGKDKNIAEIIRLIRRWGFFPMLGEGRGLRQPIHVKDVANVCLAAVESTAKLNRAYNISGGETLSYKEMVKRIFIALDKKPRFVHLPRWSFRLALLGLRLLPRFRSWSVAMADRMDRDLVFEHKDATAELGFSPRSFLLEERDIP